MLNAEIEKLKGLVARSELRCEACTFSASCGGRVWTNLDITDVIPSVMLPDLTNGYKDCPTLSNPLLLAPDCLWLIRPRAFIHLG